MSEIKQKQKQKEAQGAKFIVESFPVLVVCGN